MNMKHIQYIVEIERVRSISKAAENLYIGQPNLSRILKEVEADVGFPIFLRTIHGVRPTERGATFLQHAHNILREVESIQMISPNQVVEDRLRICIPQLGHCFRIVADYLKLKCDSQNINVVIQECHANRALELLSGDHAELGIIRFREGYEAYFQEHAATAMLTFRLLANYEDMVLMQKDHPLASCEKIELDALNQYVLIAHNDNYFMPKTVDEKAKSTIHTVDRQAQLTLLTQIPGSYMWSAPLDEVTLEELGLVQKRCTDYAKQYSEALVYHQNRTMNKLESEFIDVILKHYHLAD